MRRLGRFLLETGTALILAVLLVYVLVVWFTEPADGATPDRRTCVSKVEFRGADLPMPRRELETRWEVHGEHVDAITADARSLVYASCGYSMDESFVVVWYSARGRAVMALRWVSADAHLVGRP